MVPVAYLAGVIRPDHLTMGDILERKTTKQVKVHLVVALCVPMKRTRTRSVSVVVGVASCTRMGIAAEEAAAVDCADAAEGPVPLQRCSWTISVHHYPAQRLPQRYK